ncbi:MAG TPA: hypothetical protein VMY80_14030 [Anaerolineae bacterium]|nr:hypothetical protein [Anaerolineae bacterium]
MTTRRSRPDPRITAIRARNLAFDRLCTASRACDRRRHTSGSVPPEWAARLVDLERDYRQALADVRASQ